MCNLLFQNQNFFKLPAVDKMRVMVEAAVSDARSKEGMSIETAIFKAARQLGLSFSKARKHFYRLDAAVCGDELDRARLALGINTIREEEHPRHEAIKAAKHLLALRVAYAASDADFHSEQIMAIDTALYAMGYGNRAGNGTGSKHTG